VHEVLFTATAPLVLTVCADGFVRAWGTADFAPRFEIGTGESPFFSACLLNEERTLCLAGKAAVSFWDTQTHSLLNTFEELHTEDVTTACYSPSLNIVTTGSIDGLVCILSADDVQDEDQALISVLNTEASIAKVGIFGTSVICLFCLTHTEGFGIWNLWTEAREYWQDDMRPALREASGTEFAYLVGAHFYESHERLVLFAGCQDGTLGLFDVGGSGVTAWACLKGAHTDIIRCVLPLEEEGVLLTGSEDSQLCVWRSSLEPRPAKGKMTTHDRPTPY